ncbi:MAG: DUF5793 family protein [Salinirussus sp.]
MRRDHFTVAAHTDRDLPTIAIAYDGPAGALTDRFDADGVPGSDDVDAAFRLQGGPDESGTTGVLSLTRRLTGEYLLEANAPATDVLGVVRSARERDGTYRIRIVRPDADPVILEKGTLLVYDDEGSLLRQRSLIPSGVEL